MRLGLVVEGHGEVQAGPVLVRRVMAELRPELFIDIPNPLRLPRGKLVKKAELQRAVEFMARKTASDGALLVLLDADDDKASELGPRLLGWATEQRSDRSLAVVVAVRKYEAAGKPRGPSATSVSTSAASTPCSARAG